MEILGEHCLIESFITPECNFMSFVCNTLFLKAGCNHIMTVAKSTAKRTKPLLLENLKFNYVNMHMQYVKSFQGM